MNELGVKRVAYIGVVADLFHYGHLRSIQFAKSQADYLVCGIFTDEAVEEYRAKPIANLEERKAVVESLKCVDEVIIQTTRDPTENLRKVNEKFPGAEIILVHGDNWQNIPGSSYIKQIFGGLREGKKRLSQIVTCKDPGECKKWTIIAGLQLPY